MRTLVLGGTRSGKSEHAEALLGTDSPVTYVATATPDPGDLDWQARIAAHAARRPSHWRTIETIDLASVLDAARQDDPPLLVDDIGTWLTAVLDTTGAWDGPLANARDRYTSLVSAVTRCTARLVLVSAEVGLGVVPESRSGRLFRDELGALNARLARSCDDVLLLVAGIATRLK